MVTCSKIIGMAFVRGYSQHTYSALYFHYDTFVADADSSRTYQEYVFVFVWIIIRQTFLGRYIISLFGHNRPTSFPAVLVEQVFLNKNLNFNM